eukprot:6212166-Pyramimonas_sp.AAC.1
MGSVELPPKQRGRGPLKQTVGPRGTPNSAHAAALAITPEEIDHTTKQQSSHQPASNDGATRRRLTRRSEE